MALVPNTVYYNSRVKFTCITCTYSTTINVMPELPVNNEEIIGISDSHVLIHCLKSCMHIQPKLHRPQSTHQAISMAHVKACQTEHESTFPFVPFVSVHSYIAVTCLQDKCFYVVFPLTLSTQNQHHNLIIVMLLLEFVHYHLL